jgi:hypothetical protein
MADVRMSEFYFRPPIYLFLISFEAFTGTVCDISCASVEMCGEGEGVVRDSGYKGAK